MDRSIHSVSSLNTSRRATGAGDFDRSTYNVGQALVTTCNDPRIDAAAGRWPWARVDTSWQLPPPPIDPVRYPHIGPAELQSYLSIVSGSFETFLNDRESLAEGLHQQMLLTEGLGARQAQGDGLAQALALVPAKFFQEDFSLNRPEIFASICEVKEDWEVHERIDELSGFLDIVETQLSREIAGRSQSVWDAAGVLQDLTRSLCGTSAHIKGLRELVCEMDEQTYTSALNVSRLQKRRRNLLMVLEQMQGVEEVVASKAALACLLEGQDYAGGLELLENLRHLVDNQITVGLQTFRHTPPQVAETIEQVQNLLAAEFLSLTHFSDMHRVIDRAIFEVTSHPECSAVPPGWLNGSEAASSSEGGAARPKDPAPWSATTSVLPRSVSMAEVNSTSSPELSPEAAAARDQLHDKLLPLVVGLYRANKLIGIGVMSQLRDNASTEVKAVIREVVERMVPHLLAQDSDVAPETDQMQLAEKLQLLHHGGFMQLLGVVLRVVDACADHVAVLTALLTDILVGLKAPAQQVGQLRREMTATVQAMTDVTHGRWIKLLTARVTVHSRLKLYEFKQLVDASEAACSLAERHGARPAAALRTTIATQCRAYLEHMHGRCVMQLQNLLEAEQWVAVEVPSGFQKIVERLSVGCTSIAEGTATSYAQGALNNSEGGAGRDAASRNGTDVGGTGRSDALLQLWHNRDGVTDTSMVAGSSGAVGQAPQQAPAAAKPTHVLQLQGRQYLMVNSSLILIKLLDEYLALNDVVPLFGADIATRTIELVKGFNSQVCQLVLGAGAMKTAGLRSISAKHLALSSQSLNVLLVLLPQLCAALAALVGQPRRSLLLPEFDRLLQDLQLHLTEIHTKLVDIMHERLTATAQQLAKESESWISRPPQHSPPPPPAASKPAAAAAAPAAAATASANGHDTAEVAAAAAAPPATAAAAAAAASSAGAVVARYPPSECIRTLTRQLSTLRSVLLPILQREELYAVFGRVASLYCEVLAGALDALQPRGEAWEAQRQANTLHLLQCFLELPMDRSRAHSYMSRLSTFYSKHYGVLPDFVTNGSEHLSAVG